MPRFASLTLALVLACNAQPAAPEAHATPPGTAAATASAGSAETAATIGGEPISMAEVDKAGAAGVIQARQALFDARYQALEGLLRKRLFEAEAKAAGKELDPWLKENVDAKIEPVDDAAVAAFYAENQGQMRGAPLEAVAPQIKPYLENMRKAKRVDELATELKAKHKVEILIDPPRVDVAAGDSPRHGSADAPIQIIEFSDFQCPYCIRGASTLDSVKEKYGDKVSVVYRHFPLDFHPRAARAAEASECANDQGKFWAFHDLLFANQQAMSEDDFLRYANQSELDVAAFTSCLSSGKHVETVKTDMEEGAEAGMTGTPGFFINGRFVGGAQPIEVFSEIIDDELRRRG